MTDQNRADFRAGSLQAAVPSPANPGVKPFVTGLCKVARAGFEPGTFRP